MLRIDRRPKQLYPNETEKKMNRNINKRMDGRIGKPLSIGRQLGVECRPCQLVYRRQIERGRNLDCRCVSPYLITNKESDRKYRVQARIREIHLNVEELKL
jgi:hypothetical protein